MSYFNRYLLGGFTGPDPCDPGTPVSHLALNGNTNDSSGNGNNGTGTAISYVGVGAKPSFGSAASFNGSTSKIEMTGATNSITERSISFWVNFQQTTAGYIFDAEPGTASNNDLGSWSIFFSPTPTALFSTSKQWSGKYAGQYLNPPLGTGTWYHFCYVSQNASQQQILYINNVAYTTTVNTIWDPNEPPGTFTLGDLVFGRARPTKDAGVENYMAMRLQNVKIFDKPLSVCQVDTLYNET